MWNNLTPEEKVPYSLKYEEYEKEYRKSLSEWEGEMVRQGKVNLVRLQSRPVHPDLNESKKITPPNHK
jgi:hypothetical protein